MEATHTLSDDEMIAMGMNPVVGGDDPDGGDFEDNEVGDLMQAGLTNGRVQYDQQGRPVITYEQMLSLRERDVQVSAYSIRVYRPQTGSRQTWLVPCNLYHKWYGLEYVAPGDVVGAARLMRVHGKQPKAKAQPNPKFTPPDAHAIPTPAKDDVGPEVKVFFCAEKYPDCARFFDTQKGLAFHWRVNHSTTMKRPPRKTAPAVTAVDSE